MESPPPDAERKDDRVGGLSLQTLLIASAASAVASFVASRVWGPGTLISAAATPVVVALISEFLRRPVERVSATAKKLPPPQSFPPVRRLRSAATDDPARVEADRPIIAESSGQQAHPRRRVDPPASSAADVDSATQAGVWRPRWRLVIVTGLIAFAIVVALYTVPDLVAGHSITGNGAASTFFGGSANVKKSTAPTNTTTGTRTAPTKTITTTAPTRTTTTTSTATQTTQTTAPATPRTTTTPVTGTTPAGTPTGTTQTPPPR